MIKLGPSQSEYVDEIARFVHAGGPSPRSIILVGSSGSGKRTIARHAAGRLEMDFIEVPVSDAPEAVLGRLIGSREQALNAEAIGSAPGALGTVQPTMLFLSRLESISAGLAQEDVQMIVEFRAAPPQHLCYLSSVIDHLLVLS